MRTSIRFIGPVSLLLTMVLSAPLSAQRLSLSPTVGVYIPTTDLVKAVNGGSFKQNVGIAIGGRLGLSFSPRFGIETSVSYVPSKLNFTFDQAQGSPTQTDANLLLGSARATLHVIPLTKPVWLTVNGGASLIKRGGQAYANATDKTDIGGVFGAAVGFNLGGMLSFYVAADDYVYGTRVADPTSATKQTQNDVQIAFGFGVPIGK
ncbi:MAG: outer membrane beta-barrel protein [Gemmatimonadales bacterium]